MNDTHNIPASTVEAAAQAIADKQGTLLDLASGSHVVLDNHRELARAVLAAALAECEVTEEFGHTRKVRGAPWHTHRCPTSTHRRLVIITAAVEDVAAVDTPTHEETAK